MKRNRLGVVQGLACGLVSMGVLQAVGDGYRNPPPTAEGIGKSGVNSAFVDDASAISYNPANLAFQTNASFVASLTFARTENSYSPPAPLSFESDAEWVVLPNIYYAQPLGGSGMSLGLGITTPHGQGLSWKSSEFLALVGAEPVPYEATLALIDIGPTFAAKVSDSFAIGAGLDLYVSQLNLKALVPTGGPVLDSEGEGYGVGLGGNLSATWIPAEGHRAVVTYKSQFSVDYEGDFELGGVSAGDFETTLEFPNIIGLGYGVQLNDKIQVEVLVEWLQWSVNDSQTLTAGALGDLVIENNWDDTVTFGIGGSWQVNDSIVARAGYAYLPTPIPDETITPLLPDADRHAISFGLGYTTGSHSVDLAYTVSIYDDRSAPLTGAGPGTYEIDSNLIGLTYSLSF